ncbi:MAG: hypothetical protein JO306_11725 [Gemmatimonadetes bacterium]|nr:hypothetical protein [Gemmatimonadota bacterium]
MRELAAVQLVTWLGLFCMWIYFVPAIALQVFGTSDAKSETFARAQEWGGFAMAFYSITCFAVAFALPALARATSRRATHAIALLCGAAGLLSVFVIHDKWLLIASMVGVGVAWASILSMPYAILSGALPANRMGVYMGIFNFFIVIPEILASLFFGLAIRAFFGADNPRASLYMVMVGGVCMAVAALLALRVDDVGERAPEDAIIAGDEHEPYTVQESVQPVPSNALLDGRA